MYKNLIIKFINFKNLISIVCLTLVCAGFCFTSLVQAEESQGYNVTDVELIGNQRIDSDALKSQLKYRQGHITSEQISSEVKSLYKTGFFDQVSASIAASSSGAPVLRYRLTEKPLVRKVFVKGNKEVSEDSLQEAFALSSQRFLDNNQIAEMKQKAVSIYKRKGYHDVSIEHSVSDVGTAGAAGERQVDLTFDVNEGARYTINEVRFEGLNEVDEADLIDLMQTRSYKWWSSWLFGTGRLDEDMLEADRAQIKQFMLDHGYVDSQVNQPNVLKKDQEFDIVYRITEGPVYSFGKVTVSGDKLGKEDEMEEVSEVMAAESGENFSAKALRDDSFAIGDYYGDYGYAFANVVPETAIKKAARQVDVNYTVNKGKPVKINRVKISGNSKTYDNVIRRELRVDEGDLYSGKKLRRTQEVLQRRGYFDEVTVGTESVSADKVDVNVNVKEGQTGTFSAGAGFSSADGLIFNARVSEANIMGTGRRLTVNADVGTERNSAILSLEDPRVNDTFFSGATSLFTTSRIFDDYDQLQTGANISFGYPLEEFFSEWAEDVGIGLKYEYKDVEIEDVNVDDAAQLVLDSEGKTKVSALTPRIFRNTIDNPLNPTKGSRQDATIEVAGLGGDEDFYLYELKNTFYYPLITTDAGDITLSMRTNYAVGQGTGDTDYLPLFRRFYAGGINSVRGYDNRTITPTDENGNEYGGAKEFVHNNEIIFPLVNSAGIRGLVFYDLGNVADDYAEDESIDFGDLKTSYGFGIRWNSPMGPLRLEFGIPLDIEEGENDGLKTLFSFGAPF